MKLNHDCVRDFLLYVEEHAELKGNGLPEYLKLGYIYDDGILAKYSEEEIYHTASKLVEAKYISVANKDVHCTRSTMISGIT